MLLSINGTFIFVLISFIVFIFLMNLVCYKPIRKVIAERENFYLKNSETIKKTNIKKEEIQKNIETELSNAKLEGSVMLKNAADDGKRQKEEAIKIKRGEISNSIIEFEKELEKTSNDAKLRLKDEIETYVKGTVSRVLNIPFSGVKVDNSKLDGIIK